MRGAPSSSPGKKRLLGEAVEILKTRGGYSVNDACSIVASRLVYASRAQSRAHDRGCLARVRSGKPAGDRKRSYRYGLLRLEGEPSLWAALDRLDASKDGGHEQAMGTSPKKKGIIYVG